MTVLILAAGYGTRMYPLTENTPKALLPIGEGSILAFLMEKIKGLAPQRVVLVSNHRYAEAFRSWLSARSFPFPCEVLDDGSTSDADRLGSIGDIVFSIREGKIQDDLMVLGSDNLFDADLADFHRFAAGTGEITLAAYALPDRFQAHRYGVLSADPDGRITAFVEKPADPPSNLVSTAIYFFPRAALPRVLEYLSSSRSSDTIGSLISWLIAHGRVYAHPFRGRWFDIGDSASYEAAKKSWD
ncbi:MAG: nucleoside-diphosphate-sugar pyrophosphorylase [Candidatus Omnitrophica bacterium CG11_big_fil_rev_8_21_14_0_20_64_10]|nr:MAG: nucleoside-diphosphate-sugar pyrophosphorylase [Candidatus Omnitrophica bacterium CG11_big_fil_rev_8_21_14_0_20_64_10]